MRIGELAHHAGVNVETLRYYERRGLLPEPTRTPTGHRQYDQQTLRFVRAVKDAQALGFSLAEIEAFLGGARDEVTLRERFLAKADEIDAQIEALTATRDELTRRAGGGQQRVATGVGPLHVTNGDSTAGTLEQTALSGDTLPWRDVYHEGPVLAGSRDRMLRHRASFLATAGFGDEEATFDSFVARDAALLAALQDGREVVLWFEHDLYDQLQLLDVLALAGDAGFEEGALELIEIGSFPGRPQFRGLGELEGDELASLWPARRPVTDEDTASAQAGWAAVRAADPQALLALPPSPRPFLAPALRRFLQELPWVGDGLSRTERQLLSLLAEGPMLIGALFVASQELEEAPFHGDTWVFRALEKLAPLVVVSAGLAEITDDGRAVLRGEADRVSFGIDRWVGGTHVEPGNVWRWDDASASLVAPA